MKLALVYDRVNKWGGIERILLALNKIWPKAPLFTAVYNQATAPWADKIAVKPSFLQVVPLARKHHELYPWLTPLAFENFNFDAQISTKLIIDNAMNFKVSNKLLKALEK